MREDDPSACSVLSGKTSQLACQERVRETVKAVTTDARSDDRVWDGQSLGDVWEVVVKARIEARELRNVPPRELQGLDQINLVR